MLVSYSPLASKYNSEFEGPAGLACVPGQPLAKDERRAEEARQPPQDTSTPRRRRADAGAALQPRAQRYSPQAPMEAKGSEDETKDSKEEEPPSKVVIDLLNFAMRVVHEEMSGFFEQPDRGVPRCCGAFTPSS